MSIMNALVSEAADMIARALESVVQVEAGGKGIGTGIIWRANGAILTNHHVVAGARGSLRVVLHDNRAWPVTIAADSPELDLALLTIPASGLPAAEIGDASRARPGELVFAIGNPWGQREIVTSGIITGRGTVGLPGNRSAQVLRSDAALAPGNSGGPLLDAEGRVIGINAMIMGGDLSVAIPSDVAAEWVAGEPDRPVRLGIGAQIVALPAPWRQRQAQGLMVSSLESEGPAARALFVGDVILDVGGQPVHDVESLRRNLIRQRGQDAGRVHVGVLRAGVREQVEIQI